MLLFKLSVFSCIFHLLVRKNGDLNTAVLLAAGYRFIRRDGMQLAKSDCGNPRACNTLTLLVVGYRLGAAFRQFLHDDAGVGVWVVAIAAAV